MKLHVALQLACLSVLLLWGRGGHATPFNMSEEGSGVEGETELVFPTAYTTRIPADLSPRPHDHAITTTITRLKDFVFTRVVDFLRENLLLIVVVTSLLIVIVFIVCCASAMSHKRKLEATYPEQFPSRRYVDQQAKLRKAQGACQGGGAQPARAERPQTDGQNGKNWRTPSKALVGEAGTDPKPRPQEGPKVQEPEQESREEPGKTEPSSNPEPSKQLVCTCHLRKEGQGSAHV